VQIDHVALRVHDLEAMRRFFERWFGATASTRYENPSKGFASYFLSFSSGPSLELIHNDSQTSAGFGPSHLAFRLSSREAVNQQAAAMQEAGSILLDGPRLTGDGHWEALLADPEGNHIELTA
jgi:lactoylglutathione lyase